MPAGRKPLPRKFHVLNGTDRPCRRNEDEPKPDIDNEVPRPPKEIPTAAKKKWKELAKEFHASGILTKIDYDALETYCKTWATLKEAEELIKKTVMSIKTADGTTIKTGLITVTKNGNVIQSPLLNIINTARRDGIKFLSEFGATPSSRTKIKVDTQQKKKNRFAINAQQASS